MLWAGRLKERKMEVSFLLPKWNHIGCNPKPKDRTRGLDTAEICKREEGAALVPSRLGWFPAMPDSHPSVTDDRLQARRLNFLGFISVTYKLSRL